MAERTAPRFAVTRTPGATDVSAPLLAYLRARLGAPELDYAQAPAPILGGFDTAIWAFSLRSADARYADPLIARVYRTAGEGARARYEAAVQNAVGGLGYPAPEALVVEERPDALGAPFVIMRRMPGRVMLDALIGVRGRDMAKLLGRAHARLHGLDLAAFRRLLGDAASLPTIASVDDVLAGLGGIIEQARLDGLRPVLGWLGEHRPADRETDVVCHGDFHPLNLLVSGNEVTGVLDWAWSVPGPAAFDVGASVALLGHGPVDMPRFLRPILRLARSLIVRWYLQGYRSLRPLEPGVVRYFEALRLLQFVCEAGLQIQAQAGVVESDMDSPFFAPHVRDGALARLRRISGVPAALPSAPIAAAP
ncbi:MAG TPA: phosphotransferase [Dehalococcoidia bacterium]|nr:phosphotransferase [Dehalococcoidia bacterium]